MDYRNHDYEPCLYGSVKDSQDDPSIGGPNANAGANANAFLNLFNGSIVLTHFLSEFVYRIPDKPGMLTYFGHKRNSLTAASISQFRTLKEWLTSVEQIEGVPQLVIRTAFANAIVKLMVTINRTIHIKNTNFVTFFMHRFYCCMTTSCTLFAHW